jgi:hypothetical protein
MSNVNVDNKWLWIVLTDENQILCATNSAIEADMIKEEWESIHAAEATLVECSYAPGFEGWMPDFPPCADINWRKLRDEVNPFHEENK